MRGIAHQAAAARPRPAIAGLGSSEDLLDRAAVLADRGVAILVGLAQRMMLVAAPHEMCGNAARRQLAFALVRVVGGISINRRLVAADPLGGRHGVAAR